MMNPKTFEAFIHAMNVLNSYWINVLKMNYFLDETEIQ